MGRCDVDRGGCVCDLVDHEPVLVDADVAQGRSAGAEGAARGGISGIFECDVAGHQAEDAGSDLNGLLDAGEDEDVGWVAHEPAAQPHVLGDLVLESREARRPASGTVLVGDAADEQVGRDRTDGLSDSSWTVKVRDGHPTPPDDDETVSPQLWRGVIPIHSVYGDPVPAPGVAADAVLSPSIKLLMDQAP